MLCCAHDITAVKSYMQKWIHLCCRLVWFNSSNNTNTLSIWKAWLALLQTFRFLLQQPLHYRQCCPTCTSTCWRRLPAHTFQPPCPLPMGSERTRLGHRHLMLENRVHQCVSDPQGKQRQLPFSPSGSPLITDGINLGLTQCCSPADLMLSTSAAGREDDVPRLAQTAGGRAEKSIWVPEYGFRCSALSLSSPPTQWDKNLNGKRDI